MPLSDPPSAAAPPPPQPSPAPPDLRTCAAGWLYAAGALGGLGALVVTAVAAGVRPVLEVDRRVAVWLHARALAHPAWTATNRILSDWVWDPWTMRLLLLVAVAVLWTRRHRLLAVWCAATAAVGWAVEHGLKWLVGRGRPHWSHPVDSAQFAAMPSGHAMTAAVTCVLLAWLVCRLADDGGWGHGSSAAVRAAVVAVAVVSVVGVALTRVVLGVHWLTDTVAGALLGAALSAAVVGTWKCRARKGR